MGCYQAAIMKHEVGANLIHKITQQHNHVTAVFKFQALSDEFTTEVVWYGDSVLSINWTHSIGSWFGTWIYWTTVLTGNLFWEIKMPFHPGSHKLIY